MKIKEIKYSDDTIGVKFVLTKAGMPVFGSVKSKDLPRPELRQAWYKLTTLLGKTGYLGICSNVILENCRIKYVKDSDFKASYTFEGMLKHGKDDAWIQWKLSDVMASTSKPLDAAVTE